MVGDRQDGDVCVEKTIEKLLDSTPPAVASMPTRVALFHLLIETIDAAFAGKTEGKDPTARMSALPRKAFLLSVMEDFIPSDIATILSLPAGEVEQVLGDAEDQLKELLATRVLIIEDEPLIAAEIRMIMEDLGHTVLGLAATKDAALAAAKREAPSILLADIQLADGSLGSDAVASIQADLGDIPAVFITAFPERVLTGKQGEPAFLIEKPFRPNLVRAVVSQALLKAMPGTA